MAEELFFGTFHGFESALQQRLMKQNKGGYRVSIRLDERFLSKFINENYSKCNNHKYLKVLQ